MLIKDNHFVVSRDNSLKRLAGIENSIRKMTLKEEESTKIYQDSFKSKIVSFETNYKQVQKLNMPLLIELKPTKSELKNYVNLFIALYKSLRIIKQNKVMSLD